MNSLPPSFYSTQASPVEGRTGALELLQEADPATKSAAASGLLALPIDISVVIDEPAGLPGRLEHPVLVDPRDVPRRSMANKHGRAGLIHALAHIECNAINLSLDACWRFAGMPEQYYRDWLNVAAEEAYHFTLLSDHLKTLGYAYGDFPAHNGLWDMVSKTKGDVLARMALVPRTLEARGLDASPPMRSKLAQAGDQAAAEIVDIILRDEIGHVAIGNHWYRWLCEQRQLDHRSTYASLAIEYGAPRLHGPFNFEARRAAGFDEEELLALR
jgi:uncharacterized ferritin-like protein (DUF455 family)